MRPALLFAALLAVPLDLAAAPPRPADLVITHGRVWLGGTRFAEALAIRDHRIVALGTTKAVLKLAGRRTVRIDAKGGSVLPGLQDAHLHLLSGGRSLRQADLSGATSLEDLQARIRAYAAAHPEQPWIRGRGWVYHTFPGALPTKAQLDAILPDRPAYLRAYDGHTAWVNSKALALAGLTAKTPDPAGGTVVRDAQGEPTGALKEAAQSLMDAVLPQPTEAEDLEALRAAIRAAHRVGLTGIGEAGCTPEEFQRFLTLQQRGELRLRTTAALQVDPDTTPDGLEALRAIRRTLKPNPFLRTGPIKMYIDGVVESHTASLLAPYADLPHSKGQTQWEPGRFRQRVLELDREGWQIWVHAIGDGGVRLVLDSYEAAAKANGPRDRRHRLEHVETVDAADIPRFGALGVVASQQPLHGSPEGLDAWIPPLGPDRAGRGWAYGSLHAAGAPLAFGSDWPVVTQDPRIGLHQALTRTDLKGQPAGGWHPEQRLPLATALEAYTSGAAWAAFQEDRLGTLKVGRPADVVVFAKDLFTLDPQALPTVPVAATIFDGEVVYRAEAP